MTFLSEFSYPDISQRRIVIFNAFITFITLGLIYTNATILLKYYFLYQPVLQIIFLTVLLGIFAGNLLGRLIFSKIKSYRIIYIITDILFILSCLCYLYGSILFPKSNNPLITLFFHNQYYTVLPFFIISFIAGIKINYFLKISCGDFIDGKRAVLAFLSSAILGITLGILLAVAFYYYKGYFYYSGILLLLIFPTAFLTRLSYNPKPIYAQEIKEQISETEKKENHHKRDDLFFIYLNFTYILIYIYLAYIAIIKLFGDFIHIQLIFIVITLLSLIFGFIFARIVKQAFWFIYSEMLYPVFFIISFVSLLLLKDISAIRAICVFIPLSAILGFSLSHSIDHILWSKKHKNRFSVIHFSIFILPVPIIVSLYFIDFTYLWHFVLLYAAALLNIFIPGIYLMQTKIRGYKKMIYFILTLVFIPMLMLMHMYFKIPLNNKLYIENTKGFESLNSINYNSSYLNNEGTVYIHGIKSFFIDDSSIRNMKRSLIPAILYMNKESDEVLFIDGNRKFFRNPSISLYRNATILDYVPHRQVDNNILTISGEQNYMLVHSNILSFFEKRKAPFKIITDIPNLYDQALNLFKFSGEYYNIINKHLTDNGIFIQIIDLSNCRKDFLASAIRNIKLSFKKTIGFYFPKYIVLMSANSDALDIDIKNIDNFYNLLNSKQELKNIFYNEMHLISHCLFTDINELINIPDKNPIDPFYYFNRPKRHKFNKTFIENYLNENSKFINYIKENNTNRYILNRKKRQLIKDNYILTKIKNTELLEVNKEYEDESMLLIELKKQAEYMPVLRKYISDILANKEDFYYNAALKFEKDKQWEDARKLYKAMLAINKNNFEANYRLGILSIVLQDIPSSFEYLQHAMKLKKDDQKVLYQIGVLLVTNGRPGEALVYLEKALNLNEKSASIFYYMGLSYEELGILSSAKAYYNQALILDPNDKNIISSIKRIEEKNNRKNNGNIPRENSSNTEVEQGEDMPLDISESAINVRIEEEKNSITKDQNKE